MSLDASRHLYSTSLGLNFTPFHINVTNKCVLCLFHFTSWFSCTWLSSWNSRFYWKFENFRLRHIHAYLHAYLHIYIVQVYIHSTGIHKQFAGYFVLSEVSIRTVTSQQAMWARSETLHPVATLMLHQPEGLTCPRQSHLTCPTHSIMDYLHLNHRCTRIHPQLRGIKCLEVRSGRGRAMALFSKELWTMERCHLGHEDLVLLMENPRHLLPLPPQKSMNVIFFVPVRSLKLRCKAHLK